MRALIVALALGATPTMAAEYHYLTTPDSIIAVPTNGGPAVTIPKERLVVTPWGLGFRDTINLIHIPYDAYEIIYDPVTGQAIFAGPATPAPPGFQQPMVQP